MATTITPLTAQEADTIVAAANHAAEAAGVAVSVAVLDAGGQLLAFRRNEQALLVSGETSRAKAYTSVQLSTPTADLAGAVTPGAPFHTLQTALDRPLIFIAGGIPLFRDGRVIGAVGVGGGSPEQDHDFATAGAGTLA
ncbi:heme-binding protein [Streptomyces sp. NPDC048279]|uniref:GlcG/HbpS family heme-binding protein n=1 Tax=Streptomyces sp. NPDC048279 TaxID=3154714 RepID=UPI003416A506